MSKFLHTAATNTKAMAIPQVFSKKNQAKNHTFVNSVASNISSTEKTNVT